MGRFSKVKCFERVIQAADELCKQQIDFTWYILGDGEEYSNISKMVNDYNLQDKVILPGVQENPFPLLKHADCFVLTSQSEAQPMVLNEALTLGVPVISTDFSSAHEVVEDGVFGLIVENSTEGVIDGVNRFISDEALRKKLTDGAKHFEYDNETILKQVMALVK